jgi:hypothetical protein
MNDYEKLEQLLEQSPMDDYAGYVREDLIEFGVLVAQECAHIALMSNGNNLHVWDLIRKHFGLKNE